MTGNELMETGICCFDTPLHCSSLLNVEHSRSPAKDVTYVRQVTCLLCLIRLVTYFDKELNDSVRTA